MKRKHGCWLVVLALGSGACAPSVATLVGRGSLYEACDATDFGYSRELVDELVKRSGATVSVTPWTVATTLREAQVEGQAHDSSWLAVALELRLGQPPAELTEMNVAALQLRADDWRSRGGVGLGNAHLALTGKHLPASGPQATWGDLVSWAGAALLGDDLARTKLVGILGSEAGPESVAAADRLAGLFATEGTVTAGTSCRIATMIRRAPDRPREPAAVAFTLRYRVADPQSGAHCLQLEHLEVPLAPGGDVAARVAATFSTQPLPLAELRARGRPHGTAAESPFVPRDRE